MFDSLHEECGVFGIFDPNGHCAESTYYGLVALQHRGQEGCGIAVNNDREIYHYKDMGLVNEVFNEEVLSKLEGTMAVGHVRYSTAGGSIRENVQPLVLRYIKGSLAIAHNGNITNVDELKEDLVKTGAIFQTTSDTEVIAYYIARERAKTPSIEVAVQNVMKKLKGAFSLIVMSPNKMVVARDPWGFRPLCMGKKGEAIIFASETCALDSIEAEYVRDIEPGEVVVLNQGENGKMSSNRDMCGGKASLCIFEHIYFARPDSVIDGELVHEARRRSGMFLAQQSPVEADVVVGVPDSGLSAAAGYAEYSGLPNVMGFIKNRYIGRTFIKPKQSDRANAVKMKLNVIKDVVKDKRVVMIDDSIVRGTTCERIVNLLREAGAKEVHVRISSPLFKWPCFFGTDIPSRDVLVANKYDLDGITKLIGADSLDFLNMDNLHKIAPNSKCTFCEACFTGNYAVDVDHLLK